MAATLYVAKDWHAKTSASPAHLTVFLDDSAEYWFLYRYFESANLDRSRDLVDLYDGREIDGYQLDRLEDELRNAQDDVGRKPERWCVLTGWNGFPARENKIKGEVERTSLLGTIEKLLELIGFARKQGLELIVAGD